MSYAVDSLEDLCRSVEDVYAPGARLQLVADWIVYGGMSMLIDCVA